MSRKANKSICGIYAIYNDVNGKAYVGQSVNIGKRLGCHFSYLRHNKHTNAHLQNAFNKYGEAHFLSCVLEKCEMRELSVREAYWIDVMDSFWHGYNSTRGGELNARVGVKILKENGLAEFEQYILDSKDSWIQYANDGFMHRRTKESRKRFSESRIGKFSGDNNPNAHTVVLLNTGKVYTTIKEAGLKNDTNPFSISSCCSHTNRSAGEKNGVRLVWRYKSEYDLMSQTDIKRAIIDAQNPTYGGKNCNAKPVICVTTGVKYDCATEASRQTGLDTSSIVKCCKGKNKSCGNGSVSTNWA